MARLSAGSILPARSAVKRARRARKASGDGVSLGATERLLGPTEIAGLGGGTVLDVIIRRGKIVDGSGTPWVLGDVGVQGDRIVAVGHLEGARAARVVDASGKIVCPGFIDSHSHSDWSVMANRRCESTIRMGVTTEVVGNCGTTYAPVTDVNRESARLAVAKGQPGVDLAWSTFAEYLEAVQAGGLSENLVYLVGHGAIRQAVMGQAERPATPDEVRRMAAHLEEALEAGAFGMSTGLEFNPGRSATPDELVALNRVITRYDGVHASHQRTRNEEFEKSAAEILGVCEAAGTRFQMSHVNARPGAPAGSWWRVMDQVWAARARGLDATCDSTLYERGLGNMAAVLPSWLFDRGPAVAAERLGDPEIRRKVRGDCRRYQLVVANQEWEKVWLGTTVNSRHLFGKRFDEIGEIAGKDPFDCFFDILEAEGPAITGAGMFCQLKTPEHLREMITHPLFSLGADAWTATVDGPLAPMVNHPSSFGWTARVIAEYARDQKWLSVEEMIRKMTAFPALKFRIPDRGLVRPGAYADLVVFDLDALRANATYENPRQYCTGFEYVFVNGVLTVERGEHLGALAGRVLRYRS